MPRRVKATFRSPEGAEELASAWVVYKLFPFFRGEVQGGFGRCLGLILRQFRYYFPVKF